MNNLNPRQEPPAILLVDDERNVLRSLQRLFMEENYKLFLAENAQDGLTLLEKEAVQLVITDYRMPGLDGVAFLKQVRQRYPQIVRIVLSGFADTKSIVSAINEGEIYKFIPKPWDDDYLKLVVSDALEHSRLFEEKRQLIKIVRKQNRQLRSLNEELEQTVINRTGDLLAQNRILSLSQQVINCLPLAVIAFDSQGIITLANDRAQELMGDSLLNKKDIDLLPDSILRIIHKVKEGRMREHRCSANPDFRGEAIAARLSTIEPRDGVILALLPEEK